VLDGYGMNPGDLSWTNLKKLGDVIVYDRTSPSEVVERSKGAEILLTNKVIIDREVINQLPDLKYIGVLATGYNVVDIKAARERGIIVTNIPSYSTDSVAQMVFSLLLAITNGVEHYSDNNRAGRWSRNPDFCYWDAPLMELADKTFGIIGFGNIGSKVAHIALAFGMKVIVLTSKSPDQLPTGIKKADNLDQLLRESDILSLHCPLTDTTKHLINASTLAKMKPSAILINTGRGPLVDEQALATALNSGALRGAGVDVLSCEPPTIDNPLLYARNCYTTPHLGWATVEARQRLMDIAVANVANFLEGTPTNVVD
ncbi:MAG: D-2-hydroxyacid dehydrogenase, partial [Muribaculaceae bacterium]|nr:D-2-hydroxyacid dehydrogenase [Muribaculaceae bacterium]